MTKLLEVMEGRNPMLSATIAREMGCADSYMISGLLRRACKEGRVERVIIRGASYFRATYKGRCHGKRNYTRKGPGRESQGQERSDSSQDHPRGRQSEDNPAGQGTLSEYPYADSLAGS